jgi:hypothetical protein
VQFQVRLYADPNNRVQINDVNLKFLYVHFNNNMLCFHTTQYDRRTICNFEECKIDSDYHKHIRTKYPGACSLEYEQMIEIFIGCMLQWDSKKKRSKGRCFLGHTRNKVEKHYIHIGKYG